MADRNYQYRYIGVLSSKAGLDREDRLDLARELFEGMDSLESYSELTEAELDDIIFVLKAWRTIQDLRLANGSMVREAQELDENFRKTAMEFANDETKSE